MEKKIYKKIRTVRAVAIILTRSPYISLLSMFLISNLQDNPLAVYQYELCTTFPCTDTADSSIRSTCHRVYYHELYKTVDLHLSGIKILTCLTIAQGLSS